MAKQTFTTGQVLTAAQMTSLQQTAMGGGSATAKTASYTLVAADAGATVIMNSASATTITVNTSLFSAGDTVFIQNIGAGVSTITAGTATVNTASSLALAQYESGSLYFTAAGASIFSKADGAASAGGGMTLLSTTTLSGASTTISTIDQTYVDLQMVITGVTATAAYFFQMKPNNVADVCTYYIAEATGNTNGALNNYSYVDGDPYFGFASGVTNNDAENTFIINFYNYADATRFKTFEGFFTYGTSGTVRAGFNNGVYKQTTALSSINFYGLTTWSSGTVKIYGVK